MTSNIVKKDDGREVATLGGVVDQIFQSSLGRFFDDSFWGSESTHLRHAVPMNLRETDKNYEMEIVAPGLTKQDFHIDLQGNMLTVSFEQKDEHKEENTREGWLRHEYRRESFSRSFHMDENVDASRISARYENGMLHLTLPKKAGTQPVGRQIKVD